MPVQLTIKGDQTPVYLWTKDIETQALQQLKNIAKLPFLHHHVAGMPDVHTGIGATVGAVIPTRNVIIPAAVGVDIGCGMNAVRLSLNAGQLPDNLSNTRFAIEKAVPVGFDMHNKPHAPSITLNHLAKPLQQIVAKHPKLQTMVRKFDQTWSNQLGTLGGGNHFIELCIDEDENVWVMLHSGSRGIGNAIGRYFIELAKRDMEQHQQHLPDKDLAYLKMGSKYFDDYIEAVHWAQDYAMCNRREMMRLIIKSLKKTLPDFSATKEAINCHHNYVSTETHYGAECFVTRKGAISARMDELGIIPGSMGAKSYIVKGKGIVESFCSCAHGAGRKMSRRQAKRTFSLKDLVRQTQYVECRKDKGVLDETPGAYKDIDEVMENQRDLVNIVHTLKQVVCVKG